MNAGEENLGELVVARGDGPEMFELVEETLNEIAFAVEGEVARARGFSVGFGWDDWGDGSIVEGGDEGVGVKALSAIKAPRSTASMKIERKSDRDLGPG